jgi:hypothetical protein
VTPDLTTIGYEGCTTGNVVQTLQDAGGGGDRAGHRPAGGEFGGAALTGSHLRLPNGTDRAYMGRMEPLSPSIQLIDEAFSRFGASLLWNVRRPPMGENVEQSALIRLGRRLAREGGRDAVELAERIFDHIGASHVGRLPEGSAADHRGQPYA